MKSPGRQTIRRVRDLLVAAYGPRPYRRCGKGVDVLVDTILSQNTSNKNSDAGFKRLRHRFRSWNQVMNAPVEEVEKSIRISGLSRIKAPRIQQILRQIKADRGKIDLEFLADATDEEGLAYLSQFKGVGPKTAACTLLFAFGKAVFPVDTHIHRIAKRLSWVGPKASAEQTQEILTELIPPEDRYAMHILIIAHGRKVCKAINPKCDDCMLRRMCPAGLTRKG